MSDRETDTSETWRRGSKVPDRSSTYSRSRRSAFMAPKTRAQASRRSPRRASGSPGCPGIGGTRRRRGVVPEHVIVELAAAGEPAGEAPAPILVEATGLIFEEQWVLWRVELEVGGPEPDELVHLLAHDLRHALMKVGASGKLPSRSPATGRWRRGSSSAASPSGYAWFAPSGRRTP
jgi:hypothetical protein